MDIPHELLNADSASLAEKLSRFRAAGTSNIHFVFDFDRTLTMPHPDTKADITSWLILRDHTPPEAQATFRQLYDLYRPKEIDGTMTVEDAVAWWTTVLDMFVHYELDMSLVEKDFLHRANVRLGTLELFIACKRLNIPTVILSAGVRDVIELWSRTYGIEPDLIVSTDLELDTNKKVIGWKRETLVHTLNKDEADHEELTSIRAERPFAVVVGDGLADANMADGDESVLRIRILDPRPDEVTDTNLERARTFEKFDAIIESGSLMPVVELLNQLEQR